MPHVIVKLWPGKTAAQKKRLTQAITKHEPPRWGGYVTLKLCQSSMAWGRRGLVAVRISVTTWLGS